MSVCPLDQARLEKGLAVLARSDPDIRAALEQVGAPVARVREPGFATLLQIVTAQQVSTHAAAAIWGRLEAQLGAITPERLLAAGPAALRTCGLSGRKCDYALGLATAIVDGRLDLDALAAADDETAIAAITALKGFGRWSADIYLLFALGRADVFPAGDLAVRLALSRLKGDGARIDEPTALALAEIWRPWRGCAALLLWRLYGAATLDRT